MLKLILLGMVLIPHVQASNGHAQHSDAKRAEFIKTAKDKLGHYQLVKKGSDPLCSDGNLDFVGQDANKGLHLGHHIFFGPFTSAEQEKEYCKVDHEFTFSKESITQTTKIHHCPEDFKKDESTETKTLSFKGNEVVYDIKETKFHCRFTKVTQGSKQ